MLENWAYHSHLVSHFVYRGDPEDCQMPLRIMNPWKPTISEISCLNHENMGQDRWSLDKYKTLR